MGNSTSNDAIEQQQTMIICNECDTEQVYNDKSLQCDNCKERLPKQPDLKTVTVTSYAPYNQLLAMGYHHEKAFEALKKTDGDITAAISLLCGDHNNNKNNIDSLKLGLSNNGNTNSSSSFRFGSSFSNNNNINNISSFSSLNNNNALVKNDNDDNIASSVAEYSDIEVLDHSNNNNDNDDDEDDEDVDLARFILPSSNNNNKNNIDSVKLDLNSNSNNSSSSSAFGSNSSNNNNINNSNSSVGNDNDNKHIFGGQWIDDESANDPSLVHRNIRNKEMINSSVAPSNNNDNQSLFVRMNRDNNHNNNASLEHQFGNIPESNNTDNIFINDINNYDDNDDDNDDDIDRLRIPQSNESSPAQSPYCLNEHRKIHGHLCHECCKHYKTKAMALDHGCSVFHIGCSCGCYTSYVGQQAFKSAHHI